jgi:hypothetical protein
MKKQAPFILEIPKPCNENWAEMTHMGLGRFCTHCQKTVTDISNMSDSQVVQLFQKSPDTHCIRAFASQLNRPINLPIQEPTHFYRIAVALSLTLVMAAGVDAYARLRPPLVEQNCLLNGEDSTKKENLGGDTLAIRGVVMDETNNPFPGVVVKLMQDGLIKGGTVTEDDGSFEIKPLKMLIGNEAYVLEFSTPGYEIRRKIFKKYELNSKNFLRVVMNIDKGNFMGEVIITRPQKPLLEPPGRKTYNEKDLKNFGL